MRVGKAITTADAIIGGAAQPLTQTALAPMPTAAAVAAAAATARIQAMETTEAPKVVVPKLGSPAVAVIPPPGEFSPITCAYMIEVVPQLVVYSTLMFGNSLAV